MFFKKKQPTKLRVRIGQRKDNAIINPQTHYIDSDVIPSVGSHINILKHNGVVLWISYDYDGDHMYHGVLVEVGVGCDYVL
jgi:hypothetical protein